MHLVFLPVGAAARRCRRRRTCASLRRHERRQPRPCRPWSRCSGRSAPRALPSSPSGRRARSGSAGPSFLLKKKYGPLARRRGELLVVPQLGEPLVDRFANGIASRNPKVTLFWASTQAAVFGRGRRPRASGTDPPPWCRGSRRCDRSSSSLSSRIEPKPGRPRVRPCRGAAARKAASRVLIGGSGAEIGSVLSLARLCQTSAPAPVSGLHPRTHAAENTRACQ